MASSLVTFRACHIHVGGARVEEALVEFVGEHELSVNTVDHDWVDRVVHKIFARAILKLFQVPAGNDFAEVLPTVHRILADPPAAIHRFLVVRSTAQKYRTY